MNPDILLAVPSRLIQIGLARTIYIYIYIYCVYETFLAQINYCVLVIYDAHIHGSGQPWT
jgi:hypothetical protein